MTRLELGEGDPARRTTVAFGKHLDTAAIGFGHVNQSVGELERRLERIGQAAAIIATNGQSIDDDLDRVILPAVQLGRVRDLDEIAVYVRADEALLANVLEELPELALSRLHERRANLDARPLRPGEHEVGDLTGTLSLHRACAIGAVRCADTREKQAQIVVDLGDRADGRPGIVAG